MKISFYFKIAVMFVALAGVFYLINELKSGSVTQKLEEPGSALGLLIGSDYRPTNWCPLETSKINIYDDAGNISKSVSSAADISALCETMMGTFSSEGVSEDDYRKRFEAINPRGDVKVMEHIPAKPIFRTQGLPFSSPMLQKALSRILEK